MSLGEIEALSARARSFADTFKLGPKLSPSQYQEKIQRETEGVVPRWKVPDDVRREFEITQDGVKLARTIRSELELFIERTRSSGAVRLLGKLQSFMALLLQAFGERAFSKKVDRHYGQHGFHVAVDEWLRESPAARERAMERLQERLLTIGEELMDSLETPAAPVAVARTTSSSNHVTRNGDCFFLNGKPLELGDSALMFLRKLFKPGEPTSLTPPCSIGPAERSLMRRIRKELARHISHGDPPSLARRILKSKAGTIYFDPAPDQH